jgi:hypothetical protein
LSAGGLEVQDTRLPHRTVFPVVLAVFPLPLVPLHLNGSATDDRFDDATQQSRRASHDGAIKSDERGLFPWGTADFDFGLKENPSFIETPISSPLKVTYFGVGNTWSTVNVGMDAPNFDIKNLDLVYLIEEYFSMYFRYPDFGNPNLIAYSKIPSRHWSYGGNDTRLFVTRPHIQTHEDSLAYDSQILIVSAETGVYFRYLYDSAESLRIDCHIVGLTLSLMKSHRFPHSARGFKGSAGSGRGVRTLIDYTRVLYVYQYSKAADHVDVIFNVDPVKSKNDDDSEKRHFTTPRTPLRTKDSRYGPQNEESNVVASYCNFDADRPAVKLPPFYVPKCVIPLISNQRQNNKSNSYLISSYEDVLLSVALIMDFMGLPSIWAKNNVKNDTVSSTNRMISTLIYHSVLCFR